MNEENLTQTATEYKKEPDNSMAAAIIWLLLRITGYIAIIAIGVYIGTSVM